MIGQWREVKHFLLDLFPGVGFVRVVHNGDEMSSYASMPKLVVTIGCEALCCVLSDALARTGVDDSVQGDSH